MAEGGFILFYGVFYGVFYGAVLFSLLRCMLYETYFIHNIFVGV
jgi:hypothetical protein